MLIVYNVDYRTYWYYREVLLYGTGDVGDSAFVRITLKRFGCRLSPFPMPWKNLEALPHGAFGKKMKRGITRG